MNILQQLSQQAGIDADFRRILAGEEPRHVSPAVGEFAMQDRIKLIAAIEGAIAVLSNTTDTHAIAAATILKGALK